MDIKYTHRTIQTIAWDKIYTPKRERGLEIKKTGDINTAFLTQPDDIWVQLIKAKYLKNNMNFLQVQK